MDMSSCHCLTVANMFLQETWKKPFRGWGSSRPLSPDYIGNTAPAAPSLVTTGTLMDPSVE